MSADDWTTPADPAAGAISRANHISYVMQNIQALYNAIVGDAQATEEVIHQHKTGTYANRPAAGYVGRLYTATDLGATFYDDGAVWHVASHIPAICDRHHEDFHLEHNATAGVTSYFGGWRVVIGGAGGEASMPVAAGHSYLQIEGNTGAGGYCNLTPRGSAAQYIETAAAYNYPLVFETALRMNNNDQVDYHFGLMNAPSTAASPSPVDSIMFRIEDAGNVFTVTQDNGGGETTNDTGAVPTKTNIDLFRIEVFSASLAHLIWWKGGLGGTKYTEIHEAGIPDTNRLLPAYSVRTNAAADKWMQIDYHDLLYKRGY